MCPSKAVSEINSLLTYAIDTIYPHSDRGRCYLYIMFVLTMILDTWKSFFILLKSTPDDILTVWYFTIVAMALAIWIGYLRLMVQSEIIKWGYTKCGIGWLIIGSLMFIVLIPYLILLFPSFILCIWYVTLFIFISKIVNLFVNHTIKAKITRLST